ncbi:MAG: glycosyltransferase [Coriobacteriia bacterium]|nr:glycosyltransferase [Coriobacteriia bacterium]
MSVSIARDMSPGVKVSVVVPVHNAHLYLRECLESLLAQTFGGFEALCVDDGSTDESWDILQEYAARDARIVPLRQENAGVSAARNAGMQRAQGTYLAFLDADDRYAPTYLERMVSRADALQADIVICGYGAYYGTTNACEERPRCQHPALLEGAFRLADLEIFTQELTTSNVWRILFRQAFVTDCGLVFHQHLRTAEDLAFIYECLFSDPVIALVDECLYWYRQDGENVSLTHAHRGPSGLDAIAEVERFMTARECVTEANEIQLFNLLVGAVLYGLQTAVDEAEFMAIFNGFNNDWRARVQQAGHPVREDNAKGLSVLLTGNATTLMSWANPPFTRDVLISVIVPVYNGEALVGTAVESVLAQGPGVQLIVVDDGSADGTLAVLQGYADENPTMQVVAAEHGGTGRARNVGLGAAVGEWICFLDADDLLLPGAFDEIFQAWLRQMGAEGFQIVSTPRTQTNLDMTQPHEVLQPEPLEDIQHHIPRLEFWSCLYRRQFLEEGSIRFFEYADQDVETAFRFRAFARAERVALRNDMPFYLQRVNPQSNTHTWKLPVLHAVKGRIYAELFAESGNLPKVTVDDLVFLRDTALDQVQLFCEQVAAAAPGERDPQRVAFVARTLDVLEAHKLGLLAAGLGDHSRTKKRLAALKRELAALA